MKITILGSSGQIGAYLTEYLREKLGWDYEQTLEEGIRRTYDWIKWQVLKEPFEETTIDEYEMTAAG